MSQIKFGQIPKEPSTYFTSIQVCSLWSDFFNHSQVLFLQLWWPKIPWNPRMYHSLEGQTSTFQSEILRFNYYYMVKSLNLRTSLGLMEEIQGELMNKLSGTRTQRGFLQNLEPKQTLGSSKFKTFLLNEVIYIRLFKGTLPLFKGIIKGQFPLNIL